MCTGSFKANSHLLKSTFCMTIIGTDISNNHWRHTGQLEWMAGKRMKTYSPLCFMTSQVMRKWTLVDKNQQREV